MALNPEAAFLMRMHSVVVYWSPSSAVYSPSSLSANGPFLRVYTCARVKALPASSLVNNDVKGPGRAKGSLQVEHCAGSSTDAEHEDEEEHNKTRVACGLDSLDRRGLCRRCRRACVAKVEGRVDDLDRKVAGK